MMLTFFISMRLVNRNNCLASKQASKQAKHNSALFPVKLKLQIFKAYSARFRAGGVRLFVLVD